MKHKLSTLNNAIKIALSLFAIVFVISCEEAFEFDLPDTGSIADATLPEANFSFAPKPEDFRVLKFVNTSNESTKYVWDFGDSTDLSTNLDSITKVYFFEYLDSEGYSSLKNNELLISNEKLEKDPDPIYLDSVENVINEIYTSLENVTYTLGDINSAVKELKDPMYIYLNADPDVTKTTDYQVTLTASDANNASGVLTETIQLQNVFVPINPTLVLGDFESSSLTSTWRITPFTDGTTNAPNSSSDGSNNNYDGVDTGSKTRGMKFAADTSDPTKPNSRRYGHQKVTVSPSTVDRTVKYIIEYEYAIKLAAKAGSNITVQILDGQFTDGKDALTANTLATSVADELLGKGNFTTVKKEFNSNDSGLITIWISGDTDQDAYLDNVKIYPKPGVKY
ncbi:hypothetical protein OAJ14_01140 [Polaribacter sp.]|nr:hypothetical protein [Polaribacter sp.]